MILSLHCLRPGGAERKAQSSRYNFHHRTDPQLRKVLLDLTCWELVLWSRFKSCGKKKKQFGNSCEQIKGGCYPGWKCKLWPLYNIYGVIMTSDLRLGTTLMDQTTQVTRTDQTQDRPRVSNNTAICNITETGDVLINREYIRFAWSQVMTCNFPMFT